MIWPTGGLTGLRLSSHARLGTSGIHCGPARGLVFQLKLNGLISAEAAD